MRPSTIRHFSPSEPGDSFRSDVASSTRDCPSRTEMYIESMDLLKFYGGDSRRVNIAVRVVDGCSNPIDRAKVDLMIILPSGERIDASEVTDRDGLSLFEIGGLDTGKLGFSVTNINHPSHDLQMRSSADAWRTTSV
ncbi:MAG: hypothetical protein RTU30_00870 [Candidatus Thorarchaeota archaeon]